MASRLNEIRILGLPLQFVVVVALSLALTIYFGAWAADARVSGRADAQAGASDQRFDFSAAPSGASALGGAALTGAGGATGAAALPGASPLAATATGYADARGWERAFLFACPLH